MPRESNAEKLAEYRGKIQASKQWRRTEGYDNLWRRMIDLYRGKHYEYLSEDDRLLINISFSTINVIAPSVAVNYPKIAVNAVSPEHAPHAIIAEAVVNYWWRHYDVRPEFRRSVKDLLIIGHGWLKTGYRFVEQESKENEGGQVDGEATEPTDADANLVEPTVVVVEDRPFVERVSIFDMFVDPDATSMQDITWIAQRVRRCLDDVQEDKRYDSQARKACAPATWGRHSDGDDPNRKVRDTQEQYIEVWEFYDLEEQTLSIFTEGGDRFLIAPKPMPYAFGHPYTMLRNYDIPDQFYPMGELEAIEPLQRELNETRSQMMNHRKRYARKYLYKQSAFDPTGQQLLQSDADNVMVPVIADEPLANVMAPVPAVITPPEFYNQSQMISADIETVSGVSEYMRGQMPEMKRTATEASIIADAANSRSADKLATIEQAIAAVAARMVQLAQQFMDSTQVARITGKNGEPVWVEFDADYIAGEFDFEVEAGSTQPNNESFRRQSALQMVDALAPFLQLGVVDPQKLASHVLQYGFGVKNPDAFLRAPMPQQDPAAGGMPPGMPPGAPAGLPPGMPAGAPPDVGGQGMQLPPGFPQELAALIGQG